MAGQWMWLHTLAWFSTLKPIVWVWYVNLQWRCQTCEYLQTLHSRVLPPPSPVAFSVEPFSWCVCVFICCVCIVCCVCVYFMLYVRMFMFVYCACAYVLCVCVYVYMSYIYMSCTCVYTLPNYLNEKLPIWKYVLNFFWIHKISPQNS